MYNVWISVCYPIADSKLNTFTGELLMKYVICVKWCYFNEESQFILLYVNVGGRVFQMEKFWWNVVLLEVKKCWGSIY